MDSISGFGIASAAPIAALATLLALTGAAPATETASLEVQITQLRSHKGVVQLCLTRDSKAFPDCTKDPASIRRTLPASNPRIRFNGLPAGDYAISVIHDANSNAKLDTMLGIPREGFGFSRNPAIGFGPPSFVAARFAVGASAETQQVRMRYLL